MPRLQNFLGGKFVAGRERDKGRERKKGEGEKEGGGKKRTGILRLNCNSVYSSLEVQCSTYLKASGLECIHAFCFGLVFLR